MSILDPSKELDKRPEAAFLMPNEFNSINLYHYSEYFFESRSGLLDEGYGVVYQQQHHESDFNGHSFAETLIFDASSRKDHSYTWQLTRSSREERTILQLRTEKDKAYCFVYRLDHQLRLISEQRIDDSSDLALLWNSLVEFIESPELLEAETELRQRKANARQELLKFIRTRRMNIDLGPSRKVAKRHVTLELFNQAYDDQYKKLSNIVHKTGFTALRPFVSANSTLQTQS